MSVLLFFLRVESLRSRSAECALTHAFPKGRRPAAARTKTSHLCVASQNPELVAFSWDRRPVSTVCVPVSRILSTPHPTLLAHPGKQERVGPAPTERTCGDIFIPEPLFSRVFLP